MSGKPRLVIFENNPDYFLSQHLPLAVAMRQRGYEVHVAAIPALPRTLLVRRDLSFILCNFRAAA